MRIVLKEWRPYVSPAAEVIPFMGDCMMHQGSRFQNPGVQRMRTLFHRLLVAVVIRLPKMKTLHLRRKDGVAIPVPKMKTGSKQVINE